MAKIKVKNLLKIQKWMDSENGQMFMNYAYSWGASIVILGALFKLTHIAGADLMLFIGMGTEVIVFFISGFERTYEVTDDHEEKDLVSHEGDEEMEGDEVSTFQGNGVQGGGGTVIIGGGVPTGGTVIIGGGGGTSSPGGGGNVIIGGGGGTGVEESQGGLVDAAALAGNISSAPIINASTAGMTPEMEEATKLYVEELNNLTDLLKKVAEQSARLTRDSEEMENMNRTLTSINSIYEIQLRSVSSQIGTIDQINAQTKRLAEQIEELNQVYARMLEALKVNMKQ
ncbi:MAG: gliding motility protein GldL [Bacteroidaceae bacterium]|nr:gliding motility protein GldL [Bacteroidaceae bacterium]